MIRTLINPNAIPRELWQYRQFVCWRYINTGKPKPDKIPINAATLRNAGSTYANTWADVRTAVAAYQKNEDLAGIGFVVTKRDPYVMIDLDDCLSDTSLSNFASDVVEALDTYAERSPSEHGLRFFVHCQQQPQSIKRSEIEVYSRERFATLTGYVVHDRPIAKFDDLDWFITRFIPDAKMERPTALSRVQRNVPPSPDDAILWQRIFKKNSLARQLYAGDLSSIRGNGDPSRAVIMLANTLALWTHGDASRMDRMMRQTKLDKAKWDNRRKNQAWLDGRIQDAISYMNARVSQ